MFRQKLYTGLTVTALLGMALSGCSDDDNGAFDPFDPENSPIAGLTLDQVDRFGLPAVNTAFTDSDALKSRFNRAAPADDAQFMNDLSGVIQARYGLSQADADGVATFVLPDVQPLGSLDGFPFGGRRLADDVIDVELSVLLFPNGPAGLMSDGVDGNDASFLGSFPYLAAPTLP